MIGRKIGNTYDNLMPKRKDIGNALKKTDRLQKFHIGDGFYAGDFQERKCDLRNHRWKGNLDKTFQPTTNKPHANSILARS
ncbi:hypothetical protein T265_05074 [Opisthorchis viverrini]|uniref:Uncharacterized protein n=1 Tax=Opisthorchis viverrini TaxID=6198 RepID=A0A075AFR6_OPIVI|nr:hypothetical protein T265_05074 [Opisthorchis viverrini]KER28029.1 hypothetical protein T265_05074 [Opisthorchis viverrini]